MKKILLAAAFFAVASFNVFAAPCIASGTYDQFQTGGLSCTWTNGAYSWTLSNYSVNSMTSNQYGTIPGGLQAGIDYIESHLVISISNVGANAFRLTYTANDTGNAESMFIYNDKDIAWLNGMVVTANTAQSNIVQVGLIANSGNGSGAGGAYISYQKEVQIPVPFSQIDQLLINGIGSGATGSLLTGTFNQAQLSLNDRIIVDSKGSGRTGNISSYSNTIYAAAETGGVPEPMTFVLMGAGLVGIAALRRRKA